MTGTLASRVRVRPVKVLDRFASDYALYMYAVSASRSARSTPSSGVRISCTRARHGEPHPREGAPGGVTLRERLALLPLRGVPKAVP
jgi:hypothetical protein